MIAVRVPFQRQFTVGLLDDFGGSSLAHSESCVVVLNHWNGRLVVKTANEGEEAPKLVLFNIQVASQNAECRSKDKTCTRINLNTLYEKRQSGSDKGHSFPTLTSEEIDSQKMYETAMA
jgi:hypothetical protein